MTLKTKAKIRSNFGLIKTILIKRNFTRQKIKKKLFFKKKYEFLERKFEYLNGFYFIVSKLFLKKLNNFLKASRMVLEKEN